MLSNYADHVLFLDGFQLSAELDTPPLIGFGREEWDFASGAGAEGLLGI